MALPGESYKLAFTPGLLDQIYSATGRSSLPANPADVLAGGGPDRGGYVDLDGDGHWWIPSGKVFLIHPAVTITAAQELTEARRISSCRTVTRSVPYRSVQHRDFVTYDDHKLLCQDARRGGQ